MSNARNIRPREGMSRRILVSDLHDRTFLCGSV